MRHLIRYFENREARMSWYCSCLITNINIVYSVREKMPVNVGEEC